MGVFSFIETFFFLSLGITFVLILLLVYHFKQRLSSLEQKGDMMVGIINDIAKELTMIKQVTSNLLIANSGMPSYSYTDTMPMPMPMHVPMYMPAPLVEEEEEEEDEEDEEDYGETDDDDEETDDETDEEDDVAEVDDIDKDVIDEEDEDSLLEEPALYVDYKTEPMGTEQIDMDLGLEEVLVLDQVIVQVIEPVIEHPTVVLDVDEMTSDSALVAPGAKNVHSKKSTFMLKQEAIQQGIDITKLKKKTELLQALGYA